MPKCDNPHALRLCASLEAQFGAETAQAFALQFPLAKSADIEKKFDWASRVCAYLEAHYDRETIRRLRMRCACNDGKSIAAKLTKYLKKSGSIRDFVELFNAGEDFASLEYIDERALLFCYPTCYCACVKRVAGALTQTWCCCTLGNVSDIFRLTLGREVRVELLETIKSGAARCAIRVEW